MGRSYHPAETPPIESPASEEEALAAFSTTKSVKQAVVNPAACLINVLRLFPIYGSSKQAGTKATLPTSGGDKVIAQDRSASSPTPRPVSFLRGWHSQSQKPPAWDSRSVQTHDRRSYCYSACPALHAYERS